MPEPQGRRQRRSLAVGAVLLFCASTLLVTAAPLGASDGCGEQSYGFAGTRLLNDGISDSAGPFDIMLAAGTYDITMRSHDAHDEHPGQDEQTAEQWYFTLDSDFTSAPTVDVPDDANTSQTILAGQTIGASTSIAVHHLGAGGINSVDVVCVGFTTSAQEPVSDSDSDPVVDIAEPAGVVKPPPTDVIDTQVGGVVATPVAGQTPSGSSAAAAQLAITGPSDLLFALAIAGVALVAFGALVVAGQRRYADIGHQRAD